MTWREAQLSLQLEAEQRIGSRIRGERLAEDVDYARAASAIGGGR